MYHKSMPKLNEKLDANLDVYWGLVPRISGEVGGSAGG